MRPPPPRRLLLVWHSRTGMAAQMSAALEAGARAAASAMQEELHIARRRAAEATVDDVVTASGYLFCAPENLATISGEMCEFFHRTYYHAFIATTTTKDENGHGHGTAEKEEEELTSQLLGRPYGLAIAAGSDGQGAARHVTRICQGWRLQKVQREPLIVRNGLSQTKCNILLRPKPILASGDLEACFELGGLVAATILLESSSCIPT